MFEIDLLLSSHPLTPHKMNSEIYTRPASLGTARFPEWVPRGPLPRVRKPEPHGVMPWTWAFQGQRPGINSLPPTPSVVDTKGAVTVSGVAWDNTKDPLLHGNYIMCVLWEQLK